MRAIVPNHLKPDPSPPSPPAAQHAGGDAVVAPAGAPSAAQPWLPAAPHSPLMGLLGGLSSSGTERFLADPLGHLAGRLTGAASGDTSPQQGVADGPASIAAAARQDSAGNGQGHAGATRDAHMQDRARRGQGRHAAVGRRSASISVMAGMTGYLPESAPDESPGV